MTADAISEWIGHSYIAGDGDLRDYSRQVRHRIAAAGFGWSRKLPILRSRFSLGTWREVFLTMR